MDLMLSEEALRTRLGVSTLAIKVDEGKILNEGHFEFLRKLKIPNIELFEGYDPYNTKQAKQLASQAKNQGINIAAVHGPTGKFSSAYADGITEEARKQSVKAAIIHGESALEMGASVLVCHFGIQNSSEESVRELLEHFRDTRLIIGGENVGGAVSPLQESDNLQDFVSFAEKINSDRFGLVLDIGHARDSEGINPFIKKSSAYNTVKLCKPWLVHLHLHDSIKGRDHYPPFDGDIEWKDIFMALADIKYRGFFMFEPAYEGHTDYHDRPDVLEKVASFPQKLLSVR